MRPRDSFTSQTPPSVFLAQEQNAESILPPQAAPTAEHDYVPQGPLPGVYPGAFSRAPESASLNDWLQYKAKDAKRREGKLLRQASNRICWTLLAAAMLLSCTMQLLAQIVLTFGIRAETGESFFNLPVEIFYLIESLAYMTGLVLPPYLLLKMHQIPLREAMLTEKVPFSTAALGVFFGVFICTLANYPAEWIISWQQSMGYSGEIPSYGINNDPLVQLLFFFSVAVLPPLVEEFFFRGVILRMFRRFGDGFAVAASALLFALFHGNLAQSVFALICGLVLGLLMVKTNNIWIPMTVHLLNNGISCIGSILYMNMGAAALTDFSGLVTCVVLVLGVFSLVLLIFKRKGFFTLAKRNSILSSGKKILWFLLTPGSIAFLLYTAVMFVFIMLYY